VELQILAEAAVVVDQLHQLMVLLQLAALES
jgi:hypothetical protein